MQRWPLAPGPIPQMRLLQFLLVSLVSAVVATSAQGRVTSQTWTVGGVPRTALVAAPDQD